MSETREGEANKYTLLMEVNDLPKTEIFILCLFVPSVFEHVSENKMNLSHEVKRRDFDDQKWTWPDVLIEEGTCAPWDAENLRKSL